MQTHQRIIFGNMPGGQKQEGPKEDPIYKYNTVIFEIGANWEFVLDLMKRFNNGSLKQVDRMERDWLQFIIENHIDVNKYQDSDEFVEAWFKNKK